jgi:hypothetical protein
LKLTRIYFGGKKLKKKQEFPPTVSNQSLQKIPYSIQLRITQMKPSPLDRLTHFLKLHQS